MNHSNLLSRKDYSMKLSYVVVSLEQAKTQAEEQLSRINLALEARSGIATSILPNSLRLGS